MGGKRAVEGNECCEPSPAPGRTAWTGLGLSVEDGEISDTGNATEPSITTARDGGLVVAWPTTSSLERFGVVRWDGTRWFALGPLIPPIGCTAGPQFSVTVDEAERPVVAGYQLGSVGPIPVWRWTGSQWEALASPGRGASPLSIGFDPIAGLSSRISRTGRSPASSRHEPDCSHAALARRLNRTRT